MALISLKWIKISAARISHSRMSFVVVSTRSCPTFRGRKDFCTPLSRDRVLLNPFSHAPKNREPSIKREPASWRASEVLKHPSIDDTSQISDSPQNAHSLSWRFRYNCPCSLVLVLAPYFAFCTFFASR